MSKTNLRKERVMFWDDERNLGNSLIVTLNDGWKFSADVLLNEHVRGFDTVREANDAIKETVPCSCPDCLRGLQKNSTEANVREGGQQ